MRVDLVNPDAAGGTIPSVRTPIVMDGVKQVSARHAPARGQHGAEILADPNWKKVTE
jgi:crotonobetainyl-CoA:carnitine CoA-transferase CaiB-like acyl-CoA transferase